MKKWTQRKKAGFFAILAPIALLLSACNMDMTIKVNEDGSASVVMDFIDSKGMMKAAGIKSCDDLKKQMDTMDSESSSVDFTIDDISQGDTLGCRFSSASGGNVIDGETLKETDDTFILELTGSDTGTSTLNESDMKMMESMGLSMKVIVEMPGDIISASNGGKIEGNRAIYSDPNVFDKGMTVEGLKEAGAHSNGSSSSDDKSSSSSDESSSSGDKDATTSGDVTTASDSDSSGTPIWVWIAIAVVAAAVVAGALFAILRGKKKNDAPLAATTYGQGTGYPTPGYQPNTYGQPNSYGQPAQPQPGAQPYGQGYGQPYGQPTQPAQPTMPPQAPYTQGDYPSTPQAPQGPTN
ncbi:hypothetical protein [Trueperella sp. LYQ143]|uniref:hypothetical protein n=1 Tax=Trueperella sp. LYQ143 TaxID=3391059 RepID=UPI003982E051